MDARSKGLDRPRAKETIPEVGDDERNEVLGPAEATEFRALAARANYSAADRPDIGYAVKVLCRDMSAPRTSSQSKLKRLVLAGARLEWTYPDSQAGVHVKNIRVFTDSDWAGCSRTRKSTERGLVAFAGVSLTRLSSAQTVVALSSGGAEFVALVKEVADGMAVQALELELGRTGPGRARGLRSSSGIGRVRKPEVKTLWVQAAIRRGRFTLKTAPGTENPANILTKSLGLMDFEEDLLTVGARPVRRPK